VVTTLALKPSKVGMATRVAGSRCRWQWGRINYNYEIKAIFKISING